MKMVKLTLAGRERHLAFTGAAMFAIREEFGGTSELLTAVKEDTEAGFEAAVKAVAILAEQAELARRALGYNREDILTPEEIKATVAPTDIQTLKLAIPAAITLGYGREVAPENGEVDLGLAELNAQKKTS